MRTKVLAPLGVLVVAGGVAFSINLALGDDGSAPAPTTAPLSAAPQGAAPAPESDVVSSPCKLPPELQGLAGQVYEGPPPSSTPEPPAPDAISEIDLLSPECRRLLPDAEQLPVCKWPDPEAQQQPFKLPESCATDPNISIPNFVPIPWKGEDLVFPLPPGAGWGTIISEPCFVGGACPFTGWPTQYSDVRLGNSHVIFTHDGVILSALIEPEHAEALAPFLRELKPSPHFYLPDGRRIPLPPGVRFASVNPGPLVGTKYPANYPLFFMMVETGNSWVHFTEDSVILDSRVEPQDAQALEPLMRELTQR